MVARIIKRGATWDEQWYQGTCKDRHTEFQAQQHEFDTEDAYDEDRRKCGLAHYIKCPHQKCGHYVYRHEMQRIDPPADVSDETESDDD